MSYHYSSTQYWFKIFKILRNTFRDLHSTTKKQIFKIKKKTYLNHKNTQDQELHQDSLENLIQEPKIDEHQVFNSKIFSELLTPLFSPKYSSLLTKSQMKGLKKKKIIRKKLLRNQKELKTPELSLKKPQSTFLLYLNDKRQQIIEEKGEIKPSQISIIAGERWKKETSQTKKYYNQLYKQCLRKYYNRKNKETTENTHEQQSRVKIQVRNGLENDNIQQ